MAKIKSGFPGERAIVIPEAVVKDFMQDELGKLLCITDIGFYPKAGYHYRQRLADEAIQYILMYCVGGEGWIELDNTKFKIETGELLVIPKGKAHSYGSSLANPWTIYWIHFDGALAAYFCDGFDKTLHVHTELNSRIEDRIGLFEDIFSVLKNGYSRVNLDYSVTVLFHFLGSLKFIHAFRSGFSERESMPEFTESAIHFMRENIQRQVKMEEVAAYVGYSLSHFCLLFKKKTGYSPLNYFNQLRIQTACHYLDFSQLKVTQIAMMTGFDDQFYFSRIFRKVMGCSPTDYKKRIKG